MILMECRYNLLQQILAAYGKTKIPLFETTNFIYDDIGIYILIPKLVYFFGLTLDQGINLFFYSQVYSAFALGLMGFLLLYRSLANNVITILIFTLFLRFARNYVADVYLEYLIPTLAIIPLFLYFCTKKYNSRLFPAFMFFCGILVGFSHYVRAYSSLGVLGFVLCMLFLNEYISIKRKSVLILFLLLGLSLPMCYFMSAIHHYTNHMKQHLSEYDSEQMRHLIWHPIYLGFSFLGYNNSDKIVWDDFFAHKKVQELAPAVTIKQTYEYENVLKNEIFHMIKTQREFVIWTLFAKLGILFWYLLLFANIGLLAFFFVVNRWRLTLSFFCAFMLSSIHSILVLPIYSYALGFITFAFLFGIIYINEFLVQQNLKKLFFGNSYNKIENNIQTISISVQ